MFSMYGIDFIVGFLGYVNAQSCCFPEEWINKTFQTNLFGLAVRWIFDESGFTGVFNFGETSNTVECFQIIEGRFLIVRVNGITFECYAVQINTPSCFIVEFPAVSDANTNSDACAICNSGTSLTFIEVGTICTNFTPPPCSSPMQCEGDCTDEGSVTSGNCTVPEPTTLPPTTTTEAPTTFITTTEAPTTFITTTEAQTTFITTTEAQTTTSKPSCSESSDSSSIDSSSYSNDGRVKRFINKNLRKYQKKNRNNNKWNI